MVTSRSLPQQGAQISASLPGQWRRARLFSQILQGVDTAKTPLSYHRKMRRTDVYLKVELDLEDDEKPERLANEISRAVRKVYGVRSVEVSSVMEREK